MAFVALVAEGANSQEVVWRLNAPDDPEDMYFDGEFLPAVGRRLFS